MSNPLVSIIIPVYNTEAYIRECMDSVLNQTYPNIEVILINDGSTDQSAQICKLYESDHRVTFVDRENQGLSKTRQQGIEIANGECVCNLDSDDRLDLMFVEKMLHTAQETEADIVTCGRKDFDGAFEKDLYLDASAKIYALDVEYVANHVYPLHRELWLSDSWNKLYRTAFVRKSNVRYQLQNQYNGTDYFFNHLLLLHCPKYAVCNEPLLHHRIVMGSRVHRKNKPLQEGFQIIIEAVFAQAEKLNYPASFYENYKHCYSSMLSMVYSAILYESDTVREAKDRLRQYRKMRIAFEEKNDLCFSDHYMEKASKFQRLYGKSLSRKNILLSLVVFLLIKFRKRKAK